MVNAYLAKWDLILKTKIAYQIVTLSKLVLLQCAIRATLVTL